MKIQNHKPERNHGEFVHRGWLKEILRYVAEVGADGIPDDFTGIKSISLNDERKTFYVDYYDKNGNVGTFESHYSQIVSGSKDARHVTSAELKFADKTDPNTLNALTIVFQDGSTQTIDSYRVLKNLIDAHNDLVSDAIRVDGKTIKKASDGTLSADPNEIVKVDGKTINKATDGTLSADTNEIVKVDGTTITKAEDGTISALGGGSGTQDQLIKVVLKPIKDKVENINNEMPSTIYLKKIMLDEHDYFYKVVFADGGFHTIGDINKGERVFQILGEFGESKQSRQILFLWGPNGEIVRFECYMNGDSYSYIISSENLPVNTDYFVPNVF